MLMRNGFVVRYSANWGRYCSSGAFEREYTWSSISGNFARRFWNDDNAEDAVEVFLVVLDCSGAFCRDGLTKAGPSLFTSGLRDAVETLPAKARKGSSSSSVLCFWISASTRVEGWSASAVDYGSASIGEGMCSASTDSGEVEFFVEEVDPSSEVST